MTGREALSRLDRRGGVGIEEVINERPRALISDHLSSMACRGHRQTLLFLSLPWQRRCLAVPCLGAEGLKGWRKCVAFGARAERQAACTCCTGLQACQTRKALGGGVQNAERRTQSFCRATTRNIAESCCSAAHTAQTVLPRRWVRAGRVRCVPAREVCTMPTVLPCPALRSCHYTRQVCAVCEV